MSYYQYDGGGSVRQLTNSVGAVTDSYEYDAFGNSFTKQGATPNNYLYSGEQYDSDLGLYYLRARYYNPATGRFLSRDPLAGVALLPMTLHKYLYVGGNPVNLIDPRGLSAVENVQLAVKMMHATITFANTLDCGISIGLLGTEIGLGDAYDSVGQFGLSGANLAVTARKCVEATVVPNLFRVELEFGDYLGLASCAIGFAQDVLDLDKLNDDPSGRNAALFEADWTGSMVSCMAPLVSLAFML